jgi:hypothetical protein
MGSGAAQRLPVRKARQLVILPATHLGLRAATPTAASFVLVFAWGAMRPVDATPCLTRSVVARVVAHLVTTDSGG